jgi:hypothetical protein
MSNSKQKFDRVSSAQLPLIDRAEELQPGDLDMALRLKSALTEAIKGCRHSRYEIAAKVSELTGKDLSKTMLDQYTAESKEAYHFPAEMLTAFCRVTGSTEPMAVLLGPLGCSILSGDEAQDIEILRMERKIAEWQRKVQELKGRR